MVYYRTYRPQSISELDSERVRERLAAILSGSFPHAFLFTGPKGLGKTSTARIVAKVVNCERLVTKSREVRIKKNLTSNNYALSSRIEPCNKCDQCMSITNGTNMDVLEIDAASNRGIDEIRDLRDKIRLSPVSASKKVYIIDEVHMLTPEAFNALLKTLEEPPQHVLFVLCTTELHKVPETIVSRCVHIQFEKASEEDLIHSFNRIVTKEKLQVEEDVLKEIAKMSDGSFRDGAKLLEELVALSRGGKITTKLIEEKFKVTTIRTKVFTLRTFLQNPPQTQKSLTLIDSLVQQGVDILYFLEKVIEDLHLNLLVYAGVVKGEKSQVYLPVEELKPLIELFSKAYADTKYAVVKQLPLELAIVEWGLIKDKGLRIKDEGVEESVDNNSQSSKATPTRSQDQYLVGENSKNSSVSMKAPITVQKNDLLKELIEKVKMHNHSIAGLLRGCKIKVQDDNRLVLETQYKFHRDRLDEMKTQDLLNDVLQEITGNAIELEVLLKEK